jgi:hypothetical protein
MQAHQITHPVSRKTSNTFSSEATNELTRQASNQIAYQTSDTLSCETTNSIACQTSDISASETTYSFACEKADMQPYKITYAISCEASDSLTCQAALISACRTPHILAHPTLPLIILFACITHQRLRTESRPQPPSRVYDSNISENCVPPTTQPIVLCDIPLAYNSTLQRPTDHN